MGPERVFWSLSSICPPAIECCWKLSFDVAVTVASHVSLMLADLSNQVGNSVELLKDLLLRFFLPDPLQMLVDQLRPTSMLARQSVVTPKPFKAGTATEAS